MVPAAVRSQVGQGRRRKAATRVDEYPGRVGIPAEQTGRGIAPKSILGLYRSTGEVSGNLRSVSGVRKTE